MGIKVVCETCGKEVKKPNREGKWMHHFCSMECRAIFLTGKIKVPRAVCQICGKKYYLSPSRKKASASGLTFCSHKCATATRIPRLKPNRIEITCEVCGKKEMRKPSQTGYAHHFCSKKCRALFETDKIKVPRSICPACGKSFYVPPVQKRRSKSGLNFCSFKCRGLINRPPEITTPRGRCYRRPDLGLILFRSTWEANFARYLNHLKKKGIVEKWEFEKERFNLGPVGFYLVDFKVTYADTSKTEIYYEVKGVLDRRSEEKINAFRVLFPNKKLVLIMDREMKIIRNKYHSILKGWEYGNKSRDLREMRAPKLL